MAYCYCFAACSCFQLLSLVDPLIFGKIIDQYAIHPGNRPEAALVPGVLTWLGIAIAVALLARIA
jgi:ATP-binding cassette subfamily B protein